MSSAPGCRTPADGPARRCGVPENRSPHRRVNRLTAAGGRWQRRGDPPRHLVRSTDMRPQKRIITGGLLTVVLALGFGPGRAPQAAGTARAPDFRIAWAPCPGAPAKQCGTLEVPMDWSKPGGEQTTVAV